MKEVVAKLPGVVAAAKLARLLKDVRAYGSFPFLTFAAPGHFYSPVPSAADLRTNASVFDETRAATASVEGVHLREAEQLELARTFAAYHSDIPFATRPTDNLRYGFDNSYFSFGDGVALYCFLRHFKPKRVVEIGSGFSSALMLDTRAVSADVDFELISVEPYPDRLLSLIRPDEESAFTLHQQFVQDVPTKVFVQLQANDVLFVDSSHVGKLNSDLLDILFRILPTLQPGVIIHFHDIPWPFEYPAKWLEEGRAWNEAYYLRLLLQGQSDFEILFFNDYLYTRHSETLRESLPLMLEHSGVKANLSCSSLWIRRK